MRYEYLMVSILRDQINLQTAYANFQQQLNATAEKGYKVVAVDLRQLIALCEREVSEKTPEKETGVCEGRR